MRGLLESGTEVALVLPRYPHRKSSGRLRILEALAHRRRADAAAGRRAPRAPHRDGAAALPGAIVERGTDRRHGGCGPRSCGDALRAEPGARGSPLRRPRRRDRPPRTLRRHPRARLDDVLSPASRRAASRGKPLVLHVHATEYDRAGDGGNRSCGRSSVKASRAPIASSPSRATRRGDSPESTASRAERLRVVHNAIDARRGRSGADPPKAIAARPLRRPRHVAEGARVLRRGGRARRRARCRRRDSPWPAPATGFRPMIESGSGARAAAQHPLHRLPAPGRARPPLRARRRVRDAVRLRALRPDRPRGPPARHAGHRVPRRRRLGGRAQRPARGLRRRRGPREQDPLGPPLRPAARDTLARAAAARSSACRGGDRPSA